MASRSVKGVHIGNRPARTNASKPKANRTPDAGFKVGSLVVVSCWHGYVYYITEASPKEYELVCLVDSKGDAPSFGDFIAYTHSASSMRLASRRDIDRALQVRHNYDDTEEYMRHVVLQSNESSDANEGETDMTMMTRKFQELMVQRAVISVRASAAAARWRKEDAEVIAKVHVLKEKQSELRRQEMESQQAAFDAQRREMESQQAAFDAQRREFNARQAEMDARQAEMDARQVEMDARQAEMDARQAEMDARQAEIDAIRTVSETAFATIEMQRAEINSKLAENEKQRVEIDAKLAEMAGMAEIESRRVEDNTSNPTPAQPNSKSVRFASDIDVQGAIEEVEARIRESSIGKSEAPQRKEKGPIGNSSVENEAGAEEYETKTPEESERTRELVASAGDVPKANKTYSTSNPINKKNGGRKNPPRSTRSTNRAN